MRKQAIIATLLSLLFAAVSSAQTFYEPVQYQYRTEHSTYYYGGSNPRAHEYAYQRLECFYNPGPVREGRYGVGYLHRNLIGRPPQYTISDCAVYRNAIVYGFTAVDARNAAYANVPQYFTMAALKAAAIPLPGGGQIVPAQAPGTIEIRPYRNGDESPETRPSTGPATRPATGEVEPKAILIIPAKTRPAAPAPEEKQVQAKPQMPASEPQPADGDAKPAEASVVDAR